MFPAELVLSCAILPSLWKLSSRSFGKKSQKNPRTILESFIYSLEPCSTTLDAELLAPASQVFQLSRPSQIPSPLLAEPAAGNQKINSLKKMWIKYKPTCLVVFLTLSVQSAHFFHKFPFLTASWVVDKVTRKYFLQLPNTQPFNVFQTWNIRQRCPRSLSGQSRGLKHINCMFLTVLVRSEHRIWCYTELQQLGYFILSTASICRCALLILKTRAWY